MTHHGDMRPNLITPVILAGGSGTRLWPLSRPTMPKQFQRLTGPLSGFQETVLRARDADRFADPIIVTSENHRHIVESQLSDLGVDNALVLAEPVGRNTAPAIVAAALTLEAAGDDAVMLVLPSDHLLRDQGAFLGAVDRAAGLVHVADLLVTFGIRPTRPETGYGYIRRGAPLVTAGAFVVDRFIEKPDVDEARKLVAQPDVDWNSGMFCLPVGRLLAECRRLEPMLVERVERAVTGGRLIDRTLVLNHDAYRRVRGVSIDYAVMEKTDCAGVVALDAYWSDVGNWDAVWETTASKDIRGNAVVGDAMVMDGTNNYVRSEGRLTTVLGLDDLVVVATDDAVLVADRRRAQDLKLVVDDLVDRGARQATEHSTVTRPWGAYSSIDRGEGFQVKHITVTPGGRLSLQYHHHRAEHWTVVGGTAHVTIDGETHVLQANQSVHIPLGAVHRLENHGEVPVHLIEVQCGSYLGEDDIVRLEDVYGRAQEEDRAAAGAV